MTSILSIAIIHFLETVFQNHLLREVTGAGEEGKFFDLIELSFANQKLGEIKPGDLAKKLGLETDTFDKCMKGYDVQHALEADIKEANRIGIQSTPTFIINGQLFIGAISEEDIELML